jgi:hypothetical protein
MDLRLGLMVPISEIGIVRHIVKKTAEMKLYTTEVSEAEWGRVRRAINRLGADYVKIENDNVFTLITNKPLKASKPLMQDEIQSFLEKAIPSTAPQNPISTSRNWRREKNTKKDSDFKAVIVTWLPLKDQLEVAQELRAKKVQYNRWISPKDMDENGWEEKFKQGIAEHEWSIKRWLRNSKNWKKFKASDNTVEWQYYLNQQYAEDTLNDAREYDGFFDICLVEAA